MGEVKMKYLSYILIAIVVRAIYSMAKKENKTALKENEEDFFRIRQPKIYIWVGAIGFLFFTCLLILMILYPNDTASIWIGMLFAGFSLMGLSLVVSGVKWQILIHKDHIVYTTMFGRVYKYGYSEIKSAKLTQNFFIIKTINKAFFVDPHAIGLEVILDRFNENNIIVENKTTANEKATLNILNGQSMYDHFEEHGLDEDGIYVPFNEAMCVGEVTPDIFSSEFNKYRCKAHNVAMQQYDEITLKPLEVLFENEFSRIVLWFDEDMFCQINLLTLLAYLDQASYRRNITLNLVDHNFEVLESFELSAQGYNEVYRQVMINKCNHQNINLPIMERGIRLYFEYLKEENEITAFIRQYEYLQDDVLVKELLKTFMQYGLGDTQYIQLIEKVRKCSQ
jgi:hypothetical protein